MAPPQLVVEVVRFKVSSGVYKDSKSRKIVAFVEGRYNNHVTKSADERLLKGALFYIPWQENLDSVILNMYFIDGLLTIDIGTAIYNIRDDKHFSPDSGNMVDAVLHIFRSGALVPLGWVTVRVGVTHIFEDEGKAVRKLPIGSSGKDCSATHSFAVPGFRFKRLSRSLHWDRLRAFNISQ